MLAMTSVITITLWSVVCNHSKEVYQYIRSDTIWAFYRVSHMPQASPTVNIQNSGSIDISAWGIPIRP